MLGRTIKWQIHLGERIKMTLSDKDLVLMGNYDIYCISRIFDDKTLKFRLFHST